MKISFDSQNKEFVEIINKDNKLQISISSLDPNNSKKRIINVATLSLDNWFKIISETLTKEQLESLLHNMSSS